MEGNRVTKEAIEMSVTTVLQDTLQHRHDELSGQLEDARAALGSVQQSRRGCPPIDLFLSGTSQHLHAVDAVLLPAARRCENGADLVHSYLHASRELEVVLAHVKAHEYGSAYETSYDWTSVWGDVDTALEDHWVQEEAVADCLTAELPDEVVEDLVTTLRDAERKAPTRPHPYLPHTGATGSVTRGVMRHVDAFWDAAEGRFTPEPARPPKKKPGLIGQYIMADPRFDEQDQERD